MKKPENMTNQELRALIANLLVSQSMTEAAQAETDRKFKELSVMLGGIANSQGDVAEEYFFNSLSESLKLGSIKFDRIERNRSIKLPALTEKDKPRKYEYDVMLINGKSLAIIETKYKATKDGLAQLQRNIEGIRDAMPEYKNHKIYAGIAALSISDKLIDEAHQKGYFVLQRKGDSFIADTAAMKAF